MQKYPVISSRKICIAIVGCGRISKNHFDAIAKYENDFQLVAVCDVNEQVLNLIKTKCLESIPRLKLESLLSPYMPQVKSLSKTLEEVTKVTSKLQKELEEMRVIVEQERNEQKRLELNLRTAQKTLDRKSVKLILFLVHKLYSLSHSLRRDKKGS